MIGEVSCGRDVIQLRGWKVLVGPGLAAVDRDVPAAVVAVDHPHRIVGIDPEVVVVAVPRPDRHVERLAAVGRFVEAGVQRVHRVLRFRVGENVRVVEGALAQLALVVHLRPRRAAVVGSEDAAIFVFDERVETVAVGA